MTLYQRYGKKLLSINQDISNPIPILSQGSADSLTRLAHTQESDGANPSPATKKKLNGLSLITG